MYKQNKKFNNNIKTMRNLIHEITNKKQNKDRQNIKLKINYILWFDPKITTTPLNSYFISIGETATIRKNNENKPSIPPI